MNPRGRPTTGTKVQIRIPADLLAWLDAEAVAENTTRADLIRGILLHQWVRETA